MRKKKTADFLATGAYSPEYFDSVKWEYDPGLADGIVDMIGQAKGNTICDFGAGIGLYADHFRRNRLRCSALDGMPLIDKATGGRVAYADLAASQRFTATWDWVVAIDVGQFIPKARENAFIKNLCRHADIGVVVAWSDTEGANPISHESLVKLMADEGFDESPVLSKIISRRASRRNRRRAKVFTKRASKK